MSYRNTSEIESFHAHVYFDAESRDFAARLRDQISETFDIEMGRFHEKLVGPHPCWSYQIAFQPEQFGVLMPWLAINRGELVVFTHPNTDDQIRDHRDDAIWMGAKLDLDLDALLS